MSLSYNYLEAPNVNLLCCICRSPFVEPCTTRTCSHTFCYECIAQAIAINRQCPIDRTPLASHDLIPADPVIRNLVDELIVHCPQESSGCSYTCQRLLLPVHLTDSCQYVQVACPNGRCQQWVSRKDVQTHRCQSDNTDESGRPVDSDQADRSPSPELQQEDSAIKSSSPVATTQPVSAAVDLAAENTMLRLRLSALESVVHALRSEMFAVKHALGPWYHPDVPSDLQLDPHPDDLDDSSEAFERQLAEEIAAQPATTSVETSSPTSVRDPTDIASYFPPAVETSPQIPYSRQNRHRSASSAPHIHPPQSSAQSHAPVSPVSASYHAAFPNASPNALYAPASFTASSTAPGMSYSQAASFPASSPAAISIPALDPMTPLPDTLATLHSSLVTLAGALGALAAARGAESLRTAEELRGLRGAMHGLRMQVHDILTSRAHMSGAAGTSGSSGGGGGGDGSEPATFGLGTPGWLGYGPRPYGSPMPPPPFGGPYTAPPTNITKL